MSLDTIKDITTTARDNLVNAIRTKGVPIAEDSTINQCANAVLMITGGGGTDNPEKEMPTDGLVFYAPLSEASETAETGQILTTVGTPFFTEIDGVGCMSKDGIEDSNYIKVNLPSFTSPFTVSYWIYATQSSGACQVVSLQNINNVFSWYGYNNNNNNGFYIPEGKRPQDNVGKWINIVYVMDGVSSKIYTNGQNQAVDFSSGLLDTDIIFPDDTWYINQRRTSSGGWSSFFGYLSSFRIYNRALTADEIKILASEFDEEPSSDCSMKFYKCASVDTASKTWSGYELILQNGVYVVSDVLIDALNYSVVTPAVNNIYSSDTLILASPYMGWEAPTRGLVFYASLAESDQTLATVGNIEYTVRESIPCSYFNGYSFIGTTEEDTAFAIGPNGTLSLWFNTPRTDTMCLCTVNYGGASTQRECFNLYLRGGIPSVGINGEEVFVDTAYETDKWYNMVATVQDGIVNIYLNGTFVSSRNLGVDCTGKCINIGACPVDGMITQDPSVSEHFTGYIAACRLYNRVLSQEEITKLASEFTPTTA